MTKSSLTLQQAERLVTALGPAPRVFRARDLAVHLEEQKEGLKLKSLSNKKLKDSLINSKKLTHVVLTSDSYQPISRYAWNSPSVYQIALSIKEGAYFSHGTAVALHGLNLQLPRVVYLNKEQTPKPSPKGALSQDTVDRAFKNKQRESRLSYNFANYRIVILSGKFTDKLGVIEVPAPDGELLPCTSIPRTLIDIAVRPAYAGGVFQVREAYAGARGRFEISELLSTLEALEYKYPYHQTIGFYLTRAEYPKADVDKVRALGRAIDFYLDYGIKDSQKLYDPEWGLFYPKGL